ncbi:MAG: DNA-processing protein DprA [Gammaproteobacteria bacterium]
MQLALETRKQNFRSISPMLEMGAYEALWDKPGMSFKKIAELFHAQPDSLPSDFVEQSTALQYYMLARDHLFRAHVQDFGIRIHRTGEYPEKLRDATYPVELLYYRGWWDLVESRAVAVVGSRNPSPQGLMRTRKVVRELVKDDYTIVSGLAVGVDTAAHREAIAQGGRTIAVIGTPLTEAYPRINAKLQSDIAKNFLLISQIPVMRYERFGPKVNRFFFPERNITMSALTKATIITEAGNTSGTLIQARAALQQGRQLFILDSCFKNPGLTWPAKYEAQGAIRVSEYDDIKEHLRVAHAHANR